jgi:uncharacterized protein DUF5677
VIGKLLARLKQFIMSQDSPMFTVDDDDPYEAELINRLLAEGKSAEEIDRHLQAALPEATALAAAHLLEKLKARAGTMLSDRRRFRRGFLKRQRHKWGQPLDVLFMMLEAAMEAGEEYNHTFEPRAAAEQDFVFDALRRLHARACLIASEVLWLMEGGYASGAMARWRTLHEIAVVGRFLREKGNVVAEKYILHHIADTYKAADEFQKHCQPLGYEPFSAEELGKMQAARDELCDRFGKAYKDQWGWAAESLKPRPANFAEIEAAVSFDHYRPYVKLACHSNHAGSKGIQFDLGNALNPPGSDILLAGPSDAGLYDPGTCTAVSLLLITTNLILYRNEKLTALIVVESLNLLTDEILESFADAEAELAAKVDVIRHGEDTAPPTRV